MVLSAIEISILDCLVKGMPHVGIMARLGLTDAELKHAILSLFEKLRVRDRSALANVVRELIGVRWVT